MVSCGHQTSSLFYKNFSVVGDGRGTKVILGHFGTTSMICTPRFLYYPRSNLSVAIVTQSSAQETPHFLQEFFMYFALFLSHLVLYRKQSRKQPRLQINQGRTSNELRSRETPERVRLFLFCRRGRLRHAQRAGDMVVRVIHKAHGYDNPTRKRRK